MSYLEALSCKKKEKKEKTSRKQHYNQPGRRAWTAAAQVHTTDTWDSWDWYIAALPGDVFMGDVASGLLRSWKGRMVLQDCRYWDIRTEARCLLSPAVRLLV